jgi:hypothetical protein
MQDTDYGTQPFHQSLVGIIKFTESLCLLSKNVQNGLNVLEGAQVAQQYIKGVGVKAFSCSLVELHLSSKKYWSKVTGRRDCLTDCNLGGRTKLGSGHVVFEDRVRS